jgi:hypothetical protein
MMGVRLYELTGQDKSDRERRRREDVRGPRGLIYLGSLHANHGTSGVLGLAALDGPKGKELVPLADNYRSSFDTAGLRWKPPLATATDFAQIM